LLSTYFSNIWTNSPSIQWTEDIYYLANVCIHTILILGDIVTYTIGYAFMAIVAIYFYW